MFVLTALAAFAATAVAAPAYFPADEPILPGTSYGMEIPTTPNSNPSNPAVWTPVSGSYAKGPYKQAVFLSFDGLHQFDVLELIAAYPKSTFAHILKHSIVYSNAKTSSPSDSFPATVALFSGASPRNSGIFWDDAWDRSLYPPGSNCTGPIGSETDYSETDDLNNTLITGGNSFNFTKLPMQLTTWGTCEAVLPHNFMRVNTIFEVARANGLVTAYADKHLSYDTMQGPSGIGLTQGYFPEVASFKSTPVAQQEWDDLHWSALRNWTNGNFANGAVNPEGGPRLYGANFQAITSAQTAAGYLNGNGTANKSLEVAIQTADARLGTFLQDLKKAGRLDSTLLIVGAKQGQGPIDPHTLEEQSTQNVIDGAGVPVAFFTGNDGGLMYLQSSADAQKAKANLLANTTLGITYVLAGDEVQRAGYGSPFLNSRSPDLVIGAKVGELWVGGSSFQFENHGGFLPQDLDVPLIAYNPNIVPNNVTEQVSNRQVATTLLAALGLPLAQLDGWRLDGSPPLPGLF